MYHLILKKKAKKFIDKLSPNERCRIVSEIERLPDGEDIKPLKGMMVCYVYVLVNIVLYIQLITVSLL